jgi:hypothetical protein
MRVPRSVAVWAALGRCDFIGSDTKIFYGPMHSDWLPYGPMRLDWQRPHCDILGPSENLQNKFWWAQAAFTLYGHNGPT